MRRPFDLSMTGATIETTKHLLHAARARIGYTQSDEINLVWLAESEQSDAFFSGKVVLAMLAEADVDFEADYPVCLRQGTFIRRKPIEPCQR
jgi:tRNA(His) 5'-end guanylyltransferase